MWLLQAVHFVNVLMNVLLMHAMSQIYDLACSFESACSISVPLTRITLYFGGTSDTDRMQNLILTDEEATYHAYVICRFIMSQFYVSQICLNRYVILFW
jgi:hypothetical protein